MPNWMQARPLATDRRSKFRKRDFLKWIDYYNSILVSHQTPIEVR